MFAVGNRSSIRWICIVIRSQRLKMAVQLDLGGEPSVQ
jgi:hypothetical protein